MQLTGLEAFKAYIDSVCVVGMVCVYVCMHVYGCVHVCVCGVCGYGVCV